MAIDTDERLDLDDETVYAELDPEGMRRSLAATPHHCREGWRAGLSLDVPAELGEVQDVVLLGMGGSAIAGDFLAALLHHEHGLPLWVSRSYALPPSVGPETLAIVSSYSGETEETLAAFHSAIERGAKVIAVTRGGTLAAEAHARNIPLLPIDFKGPPRAALGYSLFALIGLLEQLILLQDKREAVSEALDVLHEAIVDLHEGSPLAENAAKRTALRLAGHIPLIYGAEFLAPVARRWKTQLNENAKAWAFHEEFPELDHNAIAGYHFPPGLDEVLSVVMLRSPALNQRNLRRYTVTGELLDRAGVDHADIDVRGEGILVQMMSAALFGDYVSYYLALLYRADPTPVADIEFLKRRLAES